MEWTWPASIERGSTESAASRRRWPTISSRLAGRMRSAKGRKAWLGAPSRSPPAGGGCGERPGDTSDWLRAHAGPDKIPSSRPARARRPGRVVKEALLQPGHLAVQLLDDALELADAARLPRGFHLEPVAYGDGIAAPITCGVPFFIDQPAVAAVRA